MLKDAKLETRQKLFKVLKDEGINIDIYDNEGATADRYTIYFYGVDWGSIITCSDDPSSPNGVWIHGELISQGLETAKKLSISQIPEAVAQQLIREVTGE